MRRRFLRFLALGGLLAGGTILAAGTLVRPSNDRVWIAGHERLPLAAIEGSTAIIRNVRNFEWHADGSHTPRWEERRYDLDAIRTVWFVVAPFSPENRGPAHTFLSFGFADSQYVAISVEARREAHEEYSLLKGILRGYEIAYVIGDELDVIRLRTNIRGDQVYLYPIRTTPERARRLFVEMLESANRLAREPAFYNTITNNCTTVILEHANRVSPRRIKYGREVLLPGYSDELAHRLGLIDAAAPIEEVRRRFLLNQRAVRYADASNFSHLIRYAEN